MPKNDAERFKEYVAIYITEATADNPEEFFQETHQPFFAHTFSEAREKARGEYHTMIEQKFADDEMIYGSTSTRLELVLEKTHRYK